LVNQRSYTEAASVNSLVAPLMPSAHFS